MSASAYGETTSDLDTDYANQVSLSVKDQNGTTVATGSDYQLYDTASATAQFAATPGSVYTVTTNHCLRLQSWDYDNVFPYQQFYYDDWDMSSFLGQNIYSPLDYWFASPGWQEIHRPLDVICIGKTYDSVEAVPLVQIKKDGQVIASNKTTAVTQTVSVGEKIDLTSTVSRGTPSGPTWTIPGTSIANYVVTYTNPNSATSAVKTDLTSGDLSQDHVDYYWVDGGDNRSVTYSVTVNGHSYPATAKFDVKAPTSTMSATSSVVTLGNAKAPDGVTDVFGLHLGKPDDPSPTTGMDFSTTVSIPSGQTGHWIWVQIVNSSSRSVTPATGTRQVLAGSGLDNTFPYHATTDTPSEDDSPSLEVATPCNYTGLMVNDSYSMYLMYLPTVSGPSIPVPLRKLNWSFVGTGSNGCSSWTLSGASPNAVSTLTGDATTDFPQWSANILSFNFHDE